MLRLTLICSLVATLTVGASQSAHADQRADKSNSVQYSLACADMGIDPGSPIFSQCVSDLSYSLWVAKNRVIY